MAAVGFPDRITVINVLTQGKELANELKRKLPSMEACGNLMESILSSYDNALTLVPLLGNGNGNLPSHVSVPSLSESPNSIEQTSASEGSDQSSKNSKKRKTLPKWSEQVRVGLESPLDDGYSWRKYGQKDILGSVHPRAYYRCSHRHTQGCLATKQVQQADDDPLITEVNYKGKHSCRQERLKQKKDEEDVIRLPQPIKTRRVDSQEEDFSAFSFPVESENVGPTFSPEGGNFVGTGYSSPFLSPTTSDSLNDFGICHSLPCWESDFVEIISNPTPFTNFSFGDMDIPIPFDQVNFSYDVLEALDGF